MGSNNSKLKEVKLNLDNISTISMALEGQQCKSREKPSVYVTDMLTGGKVHTLTKLPPPNHHINSDDSPTMTANISSVRFDSIPPQRRMTFDENIPYTTSSFGKSSFASGSTNVGEDVNNNTVSHKKRALKEELERASSYSVAASSGAFEQEKLPKGCSHRSESRSSQGPLTSESKQDHKMTNEVRRESCSIAAVFSLELISLILLAILAYVLHCTDYFGVVKLSLNCEDSSIQNSRIPAYRDSIILASTPSDSFYWPLLLIPLGLIWLLELSRQLTLLVLSHSSSTEVLVLKRFGISFPICIRRILRFSGGFLLGMLMTSILVDILKCQTGQLRPYFAQTCANLITYCRNRTRVYTEPESLCPENDVKVGRMSFPSLSGAMCSYAALFVVLHLSFAMPYRAFRFIRLWIMLAISVGTGLLFNSRLNGNYNHLADMVVGMAIGFMFALYIVFIHLNAFANRLSTSNCFSAERNHREHLTSVEAPLENGDNFSEVSHSNLFAENDKEWFWKNFHIPRVHTLRQSAGNMWRKSGSYFSRSVPESLAGQSSKNEYKPSSAYINPAFNNRDDNILTPNHIHHHHHHQQHQEKRFPGNGYNSSHMGSQLRTFPTNT